MTPDELMANVCPRIRDLGWAYFFAPETAARAEELGLDVVTLYFLGRGGVMGDVEASVVHAAFGYFEPNVVENAWNTGRQVLDPRTAGREYLLCAANHGRLKLAGLSGLDAYIEAAAEVNYVADDTALALYAGVKAEPLVDDAPGRAMQLTSVLREFRGSAHLVALRAVGLDHLTAHAIARPNDLGLFGWPEGSAPEISDEDRARHAEAERVTDEIVRPAYAVLDDEAQQALITGLDQIEVALTA